MSAAAMSLTSANGFIIILLSVAVIQGLNEWGVTYTSTHICALKGSTVNMSCTYTSPKIPTVTKRFWFTIFDNTFPDLTADPDYSGRVGYYCNPKQNCSLRISNLTEKDSAEYRFRIKTNVPEEKWYGSPGVNLSVTDRPHLQVNVSRPSNCSGDTCVQAELRCQSRCSPDNHKYTWFKNDMEIRNERSSFYSTIISTEDKIYCTVEGYVTLSSPPVYAPTVPEISNYIGELSEGSSVSLTCHSDANPPVKYTWYKKNRNAAPQNVSATNQLVLESFQSSDSGEYYCKAENILGERASKYILLNMKSSSTSIVVGVTVAILLLIILITVFFLFRRKRASKKSAESEVKPQSSEKCPPSPKPPTEQDNLHYTTVNFSQNQRNPVNSNSGAARHQKPQNKPTFSEYSVLAFHNNSSDHRSRVQESTEDPSVMYSTVNETK